MLISSSKFNSVITISLTQRNLHHYYECGLQTKTSPHSNLRSANQNLTGASPTRDTTRGGTRTPQGTEEKGEVKGGQGQTAKGRSRSSSGHGGVPP